MSFPRPASRRLPVAGDDHDASSASAMQRSQHAEYGEQARIGEHSAANRAQGHRLHFRAGPVPETKDRTFRPALLARGHANVRWWGLDHPRLEERFKPKVKSESKPSEIPLKPRRFDQWLDHDGVEQGPVFGLSDTTRIGSMAVVRRRPFHDPRELRLLHTECLQARRNPEAPIQASDFFGEVVRSVEVQWPPSAFHTCPRHGRR